MVSATRQALGALLVLALIVTPTIVQNSRAAPVSITVGSSTVSITMTLQLLENFTDLPQGRFLVDGSNSTLIQQLERPMDTAMQRLVPSARVRDITLQAVIGNLSSQLSMIEENYKVVVDGASSDTGGLVNFSLALLSMSDTNSTLFNGTELNNVGSAYLLQPLDNFPTTGTNKYRFYLNGAVFLNAVIPASTTQTFSLLDFSWVPDISKWSNTYEPLDSSSRWSYSATPYNLTVALLTPEGQLYRPVVAYYQSSLDLVAPARAWAQGSHLYFNVSTATDYAMPLIVSAALVTGIGSFAIDRRLTGQMRIRRKKR